MCIFYPRMDEIRLLHVKHRMESYADRLSINGSSGITKGMFWSPKGSALAFYRMVSVW